MTLRQLNCRGPRSSRRGCEEAIAPWLWQCSNNTSAARCRKWSDTIHANAKRPRVYMRTDIFAGAAPGKEVDDGKTRTPPQLDTATWNKILKAAKTGTLTKTFKPDRKPGDPVPELRIRSNQPAFRKHVKEWAQERALVNFHLYLELREWHRIYSKPGAQSVHLASLRSRSKSLLDNDDLKRSEPKHKRQKTNKHEVVSRLAPQSHAFAGVQRLQLRLHRPAQHERPSDLSA